MSTGKVKKISKIHQELTGYAGWCATHCSYCGRRDDSLVGGQMMMMGMIVQIGGQDLAPSICLSCAEQAVDVLRQPVG